LASSEADEEGAGSDPDELDAEEFDCELPLLLLHAAIIINTSIKAQTPSKRFLITKMPPLRVCVNFETYGNRFLKSLKKD
jgi:hypothetical protein